MIKQIFILASVMAFAVAEAPLSGPYPPSGWKPTGAAFTLPKEFLPQPQAGGAEVEISKERVEYNGQLGETTTVEPSNGYLPPEEPEETDDNSTEDYLKVQGLPSSERRPPFNQQQPQTGELNTGEYRVPAAPARNQYRSQDSQKFGQIRQQQGSQQQFAQNRQQQQQFGQFRQGAQQQQFRPQPRQFNQQPQQFNNPQAQQFNQQPQQFNQQPQQFNQQPQQFNQQPQQFNPQQQQFNQQPQQFTPQQQQFNQQPQQFNPQPPQQFNPQPQQFNPGQPQFGARRTPTQKYGPPTPNPDAQEDDETDDTTNASNEDSQEDGQPAVAVSNSIANGRYYVLTPDNTLQRVVFSTTQDEDEARTNGFTAQLRYMPVEPIRDPIYAYNEEGQLIRIFKK